MPLPVIYSQKYPPLNLTQLYIYMYLKTNDSKASKMTSSLHVQHLLKNTIVFTFKPHHLFT